MTAVLKFPNKPEDVVRSAERSLLGSMLRWNPCVGDVLQAVKKEDFHADAHQRVFAAISALYLDGKAAGAVTVAEVLHQRGEVEAVGGYVFLAELWDCEPTGAGAMHYAQVVRDHSLLRQLFYAGNKIAGLAASPTGPAAEMLEQAEKEVFALAQLGVSGQAVTMQAALRETCDRIDARFARGGGATGIPTGFLDLDGLTAGLQPSELVVVAARPSVGKTALGLALARHAALDCVLPVLFVSLEQSRTELTERLLCSLSGVDGHKLRIGRASRAEMECLYAAKQRLEKAQLFIDDTSYQSMLRIAANARRLQSRHGVKMVVVDYLQLVEPEDRKAPRQEQVASVSRRLKHLARELKVPVVAMAQLNRGVEERQGRPRLSDLRESGAIEADADTVVLMHRPEEPKGVVELIVAKQRNGPVGDVTLAFDRACMRFSNYLDGPPPSFAE